jgi:hypothetical protein
MLGVAVGVKVYLACGFTDLRKGYGRACGVGAACAA